MVKLLAITGMGICFIFGLFSLSFAQEQITITTYYPSPYGSYRELRAQRMAMGDNYYGSDYCWPPTVCANQIDANADLVVEGNVGIGTVSPTSPAPNNQPGNLDVNDIYLRSISNWVSQAAAGGFTNFRVYANSNPPGGPNATYVFNTATDCNGPCSKVMIEVWAGGGGGGASAPPSTASGGGGGGGGYGKGIFNLALASYTVTVGVGGAGGVILGSPSGDGGTSSFGALISATGGKAGIASGGGGVGGSSSAAINISGGTASSGGRPYGGDGGNGGSGGPGMGIVPGAGGQGGAASGFGGASGRVIVWW